MSGESDIKCRVLVLLWMLNAANVCVCVCVFVSECVCA